MEGVLQVLGLDLLSSGIYSVLPWVTMAVSANVGGWIADSLVSKGYSVTLVRKLMQTVKSPIMQLRPYSIGWHPSTSTLIVCTKPLDKPL